MDKQKVVAGVLTHGTFILIAQRKDTNQWEFPGGKVEQEESYEAAIKREWQEEFGLDVEVVKEGGLLSPDASKVDFVPFHLTAPSLTLPLALTDHSNYRFLNYWDIRGYDMMPGNMDIADWFLSYRIDVNKPSDQEQIENKG